MAERNSELSPVSERSGSPSDRRTTPVESTTSVRPQVENQRQPSLPLLINSLHQLNPGFFCTVGGALQTAEVLLTFLGLSLFGYYCTRNDYSISDTEPPVFVAMSREVFFFMVLYFDLLSSFLNTLVSVVCASTAKNLISSTFLIAYNIAAFISTLASSISVLLLYSFPEQQLQPVIGYEAKRGVAVLGLLTSILYLLSSVYSCVLYHQHKNDPMSRLLASQGV